MKTHKRISAALLAASIALSMLAPVRAAEQPDAAPGELQVTVRIDYSQSMDALRSRNIQAELVRQGMSLGTVSLTGAAQAQLGGCAAQVSLRDRTGGELIGTADPGALDLTVTGLPQGDYTLRVIGKGYARCEVPFSIQDYSHYIELGTGDGTFALGDFDGNGRVDAKDRDALTGALGSTNQADLDQYDLNGDDQIDIVDLAYVNHNANTPAASPAVLDTVCIGVQADEDQAAADLAGAGTQLTAGSLQSLFQTGSGRATFRNAAGQGTIRIPIPLNGAVTAENLQITTPDSEQGAIQAGTVEVEYEGGTISRTFSFGSSRYADVYAIAPDPGHNVIVIPLGKRVAVKKVTITVTKTAGGEYATVESIRFLQDIIPEGLTEPNSLVKNLSAVPGDGRVSLKWNELPNVSGYRVEYWEKDKESARRQVNVDVPQAQISGLENLNIYCFTVTPTDGAWQGQTCAPVEAAPQPAKAPSAPDMVSVTPLDGQLSVSWKAGENAVWYEVYYTDQANASTASYRQAGGQVTGSSLTIPDLVNGTTYYIYVVAGNDAGRSGPSRIAEGTPKATDYSRPAGIPTEGILEGNDIQRVWLADSGNVSPSSYSAAQPFQPAYMNDGDLRTHWTSQSWDDGNWARSKTVFASFSQPVDISSVIWVPRLDGDYANYLRLYTVTVWREGDDLKGPGTLVSPDPLRGGSAADHATWLGVRNNPGVTKFAVLPFEPVTDVVQVSITIEQVGYSAVSLSELMFMEYDPAHSLPDNIAALFANELRTQLAAGVTQSDIDGLKARLNSGEINYYLNPETLADELVLAQELLDTQSTSGVVLNGVQSRSSGADSAKYSQGGSDLQPLGVAAKAGEEITVYASGIPDGAELTVFATQFNAEVSAWRAKAGTLVNGRNILTVPAIGSQATERGGSLYLTYSGANPEQIQLHVRRAVDIPVLELSDWYDLNVDARRTRIGAYVDELTRYVAAQNITNSNAQTKTTNVTEISTPTVLLSLPAAAVLGANSASRDSKVENLYQDVLAWEDLMHICKTTQGINNTYEKNDMTSRQNIRCMQMFAGAFMYAAGSHIGIGYGSCAGMVSGLPIAKLPAGAAANSLFGWGIAHEIGHNMDKLGQAEITNNIYSLMVQTYDGADNTFQSRLEKSGKYPAIFTKTAQSQPGVSNDVFVQLGMYWQLHLAYDGAQNDEHGPMWFYNQFFLDWKKGTYTAGAQSYDDRVALTAAGVVKKDLTEFFERWGMSLSPEAKKTLADYAAEPRALWYLSDQSRRERLSGSNAATGTLTAQAALNGDNAILITITPELNGKVQGYEIIRNNKSIAFVVPGAEGAVQYEDVIGSGNHRTYQYQVAAYDILGNRIAAAETDEVRVAYDKTVDPSAYTMTRSGSTATFQFSEAASISGLKLTGSNRPTSGAYTITVEASFTGEDKKPVTRTVTAREGSFDAGNQAVDDQDSYLTYFQKPGAASDDTRIWTYDAKTLTVTGIPADMADSDIRLISYAGDDVAFWEAGAVGRLSADYRYGDGDGDVIPKDTLVIVGTYRGDPRFNTVKVMGRFTRTTDAGEELNGGEAEERYLDGYALLFAEIPADQQVSDISDGLFIFVPDVQREAELQEVQGEDQVNRCDGSNLLPSQMKLVLSRTDLPDAADSQRVTAETLWISSPGGEHLPVIVLEVDEG